MRVARKGTQSHVLNHFTCARAYVLTVNITSNVNLTQSLEVMTMQELLQQLQLTAVIEALEKAWKRPLFASSSIGCNAAPNRRRTANKAAFHGLFQSRNSARLTKNQPIYRKTNTQTTNRIFIFQLSQSGKSICMYARPAQNRQSDQRLYTRALNPHPHNQDIQRYTEINARTD